MQTHLFSMKRCNSATVQGAPVLRLHSALARATAAEVICTAISWPRARQPAASEIQGASVAKQRLELPTALHHRRRSGAAAALVSLRTVWLAALVQGWASLQAKTSLGQGGPTAAAVEL